MTCANASDLANSPRLPIDGQAGYLDIAGCQPYFEALLATIKLDPASALDPPNPS